MAANYCLGRRRRGVDRERLLHWAHAFEHMIQSTFQPGGPSPFFPLFYLFFSCRRDQNIGANLVGIVSTAPNRLNCSLNYSHAPAGIIQSSTERLCPDRAGQLCWALFGPRQWEEFCASLTGSKCDRTAELKRLIKHNRHLLAH